MLLAHGVGGTVRHLGRGALALEREQRRDGLGLSCIAVALIVALGAWADSAGPVGHYLTIGLRGLIGSGVMLLPVVLAAAAWRLLRRPSPDAPRGRAAVGWLLVAIGVLGILDLVHGDPTGATARRAAGGVIGVLAGSPLATAVTSYVAVPVLALVAVFGLLVVTGTPLHAVPDRIRGIRHGGRDGESDEATDLPETTKVRRRRPVVKTDVDAPFAASPVLGDGALGDGESAGAPAVPVSTAPAPRQGKQLRLGDGSYRLPGMSVLGEGAPAKARSNANDLVIAALTGVFRGVRRGCHGDRLHPRTDGDPLRGGARARRSRSSGSRRWRATSRTPSRAPTYGSSMSSRASRRSASRSRTPTAST